LDVPLADTLVVFMGASNQKELAQLFIKKGYDGNTPVAVCHRVSFSDSDTRRYTLSSLSESNELLPSPSIMIVGQTAASRAGRTVRRWLYTGSRLPAWKNTDGALVHAPLVSIRADYSAEPANIFNCDSILFPGRNAVEHFFRYLAHHKIDLRAVLDKRLLALTPSASHALKGIGLYIDPEFEGSTEEGIFRINRWIKLGGEKVLLPCSSVGMPELISTLKGVNAQVDCLTLFEVIRNPRPVRHDLGMFSGVMFSSALSVSHFCELYGGFPQNMEYRFSDTGAKELFIQLSGTSESNSVSV
jgi:uroporphyrinogen III methyltransferase/synthase